MRLLQRGHGVCGTGEIDAAGVHMLSTGGMLSYAKGAAGGGGTAVVATEVGMLYPLRAAAPDVDFVAANPEASCRYMKMITLPKLRDSLRNQQYRVSVEAEIAAAAQRAITRMIAIG